MTVDARKNFALSTVAVAPSPATSGTSLTLVTGGGALMPAPPFNVTCWPLGTVPTLSNAEIVRVEGVEGDELTPLKRAQEGTTAKSIAVGWQVANTITALTIEELVELVESEAARAEAAEATLTTNLAGEVTARTAAVTAEKTRAEGAEGTLTTSVATAKTETATEKTRAEAAEATKASATALGSETTARESGDSTNATAISTETTRAKAGEKSAQETSEASAAAKVKVEEEARTAADALKAPLASPALTGTPTAPTATPSTDTTQLATTAFVQALVSAAIEGLNAHPNVVLATTAALPANAYVSGVLTGSALGALTIDETAAVVGQRVLVKNEVAAANNGLYVVTKAGGVAEAYVLTRAADMNENAEVAGAFVFAESGKTNKNNGFFVASPGPFVIGTTAIIWSQFTGAGDLTAGEGITLTGNTVAVAASVVSDNRGITDGDILVRSGGTFARLARGTPGQQMIVRLDGTISYVDAPAISVDAWGAVGDGMTDDTAAFQAAGKAASTQGGGTVRMSHKAYVVDGLIWENAVFWQGDGRGTILRAKAGSSNEGLVIASPGLVTSGGWKNVLLEGAENANQDGFYLLSGEVNLGVSSASFENVQVGTRTKPFLRNGIWFRGGATGSAEPHQFVTFRNVRIVRPNTGAAALTSRCLKITGQCEKFQFDTACSFYGASNEKVIAGRVGTNVEIGREFIFGTTLSSESAAGALVIQVASAVAGLGETKKLISIGEGSFNEVAEVESIEGTTVTLKKALVFAHAASTNVYLLSGTVASPSTRAPKEIIFHGGAIQTADLHVLVDAAAVIDFYGTDFEEQNRTLRVRAEAISINLHGCHLNTASEGTSNGNGIVTAGSATVTGVTGIWTIGERIAGAGIPPGATVLAVGAGTIELSASAEANGTTAELVALTKGGKGEGYAALYEGKSTGTCSGFIKGSIDRTVINVESGARVQSLFRTGTPLATRISSGVTLALKTATALTIYAARDVALTDAAKQIQTIKAHHAVGEEVTFRATIAGTQFIEGGNINLPGGTLTLGVGDFASFLRTDYGTMSWVLISVQRANEPQALIGNNGLLFPIALGGPIPNAEGAIGGTNKAWAARTRPAEKAGSIKSLLLAIGKTVTAGEKVRAAIFDTGAASNAHYSVLWESAEVEVVEAAKETLLALGEPNVAVALNQQFVFAFMSNSTTGTFGRRTQVASAYPGWYVLPFGASEWFPSTGLTKPRLAGTINYGSLSFGGAGTALAEAEMGGGANVPGLLARVG